MVANKDRQWTWGRVRRLIIDDKKPRWVLGMIFISTMYLHQRTIER